LIQRQRQPWGSAPNDSIPPTRIEIAIAKLLFGLAGQSQCQHDGDFSNLARSTVVTATNEPLCELAFRRKVAVLEGVTRMLGIIR